MKNILILTDFSANATHAAEYGYHLATQVGANIILCNVINILNEIPQVEFVSWPLGGEDILKDLSDIELKDLKKHLQYQHLTGFYPIIKSINYSCAVEDLITNTVERYEIGLIVMGTHESGSLRDIFLSNHIQSMILKTTVPLLLVPPIAAEINIRRIAFASDLKHIAIDLEHIFSLVAFAKSINADFLITHVGIDEHDSPLSAQQIEKLLAEISLKSGYPHFYYKYLNYNSTETGLEWLCANENISILAILPRKRNFIERLISGGLTQKVVKHLAIPLLVFPAQ